VSEPTTTRGAIHDLGYKRYVGTRLAPSRRWRVIMREQIKNGWKKWWRYKLALGGAVLTACIAGGFLFMATNQVVRSFGNAGGGNIALTMADAVVPLSLEWFCKMGFVLSLTLGATIIANDTQSGAFTFYYVRSVRPRDYVLGKLTGYGLLVATLVLAGPVLLACFRLGMSADTDELLDTLVILPKVLAIGGLATVAYTAVPLAISALVPNRRYALALWAAYYLIVGNIALGVGLATESNLGNLDLPTALKAVTYDLFDVTIILGRGHVVVSDRGTIIAIASIAIQSVLAVAIIWYQVSRDQRHGVGGSS
jgi:hypothetical protein